MSAHALLTHERHRTAKARHYCSSCASAKTRPVKQVIKVKRVKCVLRRSRLSCNGLRFFRKSKVEANFTYLGVEGVAW